LGETAPGHVHGPGCGHADHHHHAHPAASGAADPDHRHDHDGHDQGEGEEHPEGISNGMVLLLKHLGLQELAANLLWVQMDADSHQGLWHRVEFALELIPTIDPHFVEAYLLHAYMLDRFKGEHRRSIEVLQTGLRNNPWRSELWIQLGVQFFNVNRQHGPDRDLEKALAMFSQACRLSDCPGYIFRFRAIVLTCLNRREEAIAWLEQVRASPGRFGGDQQQDDHLLQRLRAGETWE
jgi:tetratricopeptide (TPR) repeat protein